jgi:hypothetical protein
MQIQVWAAPSSGRLAVASLIVLVALAVSPRSVFAQFSDALVAENSELQLLERAGGGAYQRYLITLTSNDGVVVLATNKDGAESKRKVAVADYLALWRELQDSNLDTLLNATMKPNAPDGSRFTVKYRAGGASGEFSAAGVDSLADTRYRTIVRAVLDFASKH